MAKRATKSSPRKKSKPAPAPLAQVRGTTATVPMSEDIHKPSVATQEQCIADLRWLAEAEPDKVISRNYYRVNGSYAESAWNAHFGTFHEFKRQANIVLSRHAHRHERNIAKHASITRMRVTTQEKIDWSGKWLKPTGKRFQTVLTGTDIHDIECDPFWRRCFVDTAQRLQPDVIVLNGDIFDLPEFSKYPVDPREWDVTGRIVWVHNFLEDLREACPDAEIVFIEGNHEFRLFRHLSEATPALKTILGDLHGMTIPSILGIDKYQVNFIGHADLGAFNERDIQKEVSKNYWVGWDCLLGHHYPEGKQMGLPGWNGHHHKHEVRSFYSPLFKQSEWHQIGAGHRRSATYCAGEKWSNGILISYVDTQAKTTAFDHISVLDYAVIGGKWFERQADERVTTL